MAEILQEFGVEPPTNTNPLLDAAIAVTEPFEKFYSGLGARYPWQRVLLGTTLASALVWLAEPSFAFDERGQPRQFRPFAPEDPDATLFHWAVLPVAFGLFSGFFV